MDESGCHEFYQRELGRAPRGVRVEDVRCGRKFGRTNVIAAKRCDAILAPKTYCHTTNKRFFMDWFEFDLLSVVPPGHTIIMDNASFHPKKELYKMADRYSVKLLFLPPYSPDFNPIEKFWANLKRWLRDFLCFYDSLHAALYDRLVLFLS